MLVCSDSKELESGKPESWLPTNVVKLLCHLQKN